MTAPAAFTARPMANACAALSTAHGPAMMTGSGPPNRAFPTLTIEGPAWVSRETSLYGFVAGGGCCPPPRARHRHAPEAHGLDFPDDRVYLPLAGVVLHDDEQGKSGPLFQFSERLLEGRAHLVVVEHEDHVLHRGRRSQEVRRRPHRDSRLLAHRVAG